MKSEIANMSEKLDTLMAQRQTEDEGQFWLSLKRGTGNRGMGMGMGMGNGERGTGNL